LITTVKGIILWVSDTYTDKTHDITLARDADDVLPQQNQILADLGFQGLQKTQPNVRLPHKKPQRQDLTPEQIQQNRQHAAKRVIVENTIAHVKILRMVKDICRLRSVNIHDSLFKIACAFHNFRRMGSLT